MATSNHQQCSTLMIQGTTSDAGKTTLVAGLCRLFARRGVSVAPFKPQNMALNSAVTVDEGEIGRSQALQALACGLPPHSDMNPVLLKPNSNVGAQIIVQGKALTNLDAMDFHLYKPMAMKAVLESHRRLQSNHSLILAEGAGSPAEINLRRGDIANMGFAEAIDCPVVLIADIDRGGVFAHLVGTLELLSRSEQQRVVGFIINRFRGDIRLLEDGLSWLESKTGKPVLGVIPYLNNLQLDAEDALSTDQELDVTRELSRLNVKVLVYPHVSNHTDFDVLRLHPQVNLQYVGRHPQAQPDLENADLVILPGSKNVRTDLDWLRAEGFDDQLNRHLRYGGKLLGICGGFQMLGESVEDSLGIESAPGVTPGLGYLQMHTRLRPEKRLKNLCGVFARNQNVSVRGYEIHCGESSGPSLQNPLLRLNGNPEGAISADNRIIGTYLHGIFDDPAALDHLLRWSGLKAPLEFDRDRRRLEDLDRLADCLDEQIDWETFSETTAIPFDSGRQSASFERADSWRSTLPRKAAQ